MIVLLDTTVLIDVLRARESRRTLLAELVVSGHRLATAAINIAEIYSGMRAGEHARTEAFLSSIECYPMTAAIASPSRQPSSRVGAEGKDTLAASHDHCRYRT